MTVGGPSERARPPVEISHAFLNLVSTQRWDEAVCLIDPLTKERFRDWWLRKLAEPRTPVPAETDTYFLSLEAMLGVRDQAEAESLTPDELLARHAAARARQMARFAPQGDASALPTFVHLRTRREGDTVDCEFRRVGAEAMAPHLSATQRVRLVKRESRWFVRDADLLGYGDGHILPPDGHD